jgi:hypothetical protein
MTLVSPSCYDTKGYAQYDAMKGHPSTLADEIQRESGKTFQTVIDGYSNSHWTNGNMNGCEGEHIFGYWCQQTVWVKWKH